MSRFGRFLMAITRRVLHQCELLRRTHALRHCSLRELPRPSGLPTQAAGATMRIGGAASPNG